MVLECWAQCETLPGFPYCLFTNILLPRPVGPLLVVTHTELGIRLCPNLLQGLQRCGD